MTTHVCAIADTHIHQEMSKLSEEPGFRLVSMQVNEWAARIPNDFRPWILISRSLGEHDSPFTIVPVAWLVVYESDLEYD